LKMYGSNFLNGYISVLCVVTVKCFMKFQLSFDIFKKLKYHLLNRRLVGYLVEVVGR